jgi:hypothetical protein
VVINSIDLLISAEIESSFLPSPPMGERVRVREK